MEVQKRNQTAVVEELASYGWEVAAERWRLLRFPTFAVLSNLPEVAGGIRRSHFMACCGRKLFFRECNTPEQGWPCGSAGDAPAVSGHWNEPAQSIKGVGAELPPLWTVRHSLPCYTCR